MRRTLPLLVTLLCLASAPAADAAWFGAEAVDGPADILALGGVDLGRDGPGGLVYLKRDGADPHVFVSRLIDGTWRAPERVDGAAPASEAAIAAGDGGRLALAWISGGDVWATVIEAKGQPARPAVQLSSGAGATGLALDMGANGHAYAIWRQPGAGGGDIRAARLDGVAWTGVPAALDVDPAHDAGAGTARPDIGVDAGGNAVAVWGEAYPDGRTHVVERRLTGVALAGGAPQDLTPDAVDGAAAGSADSPDVDVEYDGSYAWIAWRQAVAGGVRGVARRLRGNRLENLATIDGGGAAGAPHVTINGLGAGLAAVGQAGGPVVGSMIGLDALQPPARLDATGSVADPAPVVAYSERGQPALAWRAAAADGSASVHARFAQEGKPFEGEATLSDGARGAVVPEGVAIGADRVGDVAVAILQGAPGSRFLSVASYDIPPARPIPAAGGDVQRRARPLLKWTAGLDNMGPQTFKVLIDGKEVATTTATAVRLPVVLDGVHRWQVVGIDRHGQAMASRSRKLRIDTVAPKLKVTVSGMRARGQALRVSVKASDRRGSGVRDIRVDYGDRSRPGRKAITTHRYGRSGGFTLEVRVADKAGNVARKRIKLKIK